MWMAAEMLFFWWKEVRKLVHEDVSRETMNKSINIAVKVSKPTLKAFIKALKFVVGKPTKAIGKALRGR